MRKQTARVGLSVAVLPMTALALHGLPGGSQNPPTHITAAEAVHQQNPRPGAAFFTKKGRSHTISQADSNSSTTVNRVGAELIQASSQVLAQGQVIEAQNARYAQDVARQRANAASRASANAAIAHEVSAQTASYTAPPSVSASMASALSCIRQYESGDNYADTSNPYYRGAYQFAWSTWQSVGGTGDPAAASPSEQDMRATMLAEKGGWSAWSTASMCGV